MTASVRPLLAVAILGLCGAECPGAPKWDPVPAAELSGNAPSPEDSDVPAVIIFKRVDFDDSYFPQERNSREYVRYKIYDPEKATSVTRISSVSVSVNGMSVGSDFRVYARLTNPDGSVREFGKEAMQERDIVRSAVEQTWVQRLFGSGGVDVREKFLAVPGIQKGAVLDIQATNSLRNLDAGSWNTLIPLQVEGIPEKELTLHYRRNYDPGDWNLREFTLNGVANRATTVRDPKGQVATISGKDVPPLYREPFSGPLSSHELTFVISYAPARLTILSQNSDSTAITVEKKSGPWAGYATKMYLFEHDRARATSRVKALAAQLTMAPGTDEEKAARIHDYVVDLYQRFLRRPAPTAIPDRFATISSLDQVLNFDKNTNVNFESTDFVWLEIALDRAAGWEAHTVMLPDLDLYPFDDRLVADMFLPVAAARIRLGGQWEYSIPDWANPPMFGELPWETAGVGGLVAAPNAQQFVPAPLPEASFSRIENDGEFSLGAGGALSGSATRTYWGQCALVERAHIRRMVRERQKFFFHKSLNAELTGAEITVTGVEGGSDNKGPVKVSYDVQWPDFGVSTSSRVIARPAVFRATSVSPFTDDVRHNPLVFPYKWTETDHVVLSPPSGFTVESKHAPPSIPGDVMNYTCSIALERKSGRIHYDREFVSNLMRAPASVAAPLKRFYDGVVASDQFELVFLKAKPDAAPDTEAP